MKIQRNPDDITITLDGAERLWALQSKVVIPAKNIKDIVWHDTLLLDTHMLRLGGTGAPRVLYAGHFYGKDGWQFLYLKHPKGIRKVTVKNVLEIITEGHKYTRLLLSLDKKTAQSLLLK
jgi:hypothetical protein